MRGAPATSLETSAAVTPEHVASQRPLIESLHRLLIAAAGRTPHFGCFGLHEWAMVFRLAEGKTRHADRGGLLCRTG